MGPITSAASSLPDLVAAFQGDGTGSAEYLEALEEVFEATNGEIAAFYPEEGRFERLAAEAEALAQRFPDTRDRPPLFGVPVGVKDIFHVDGFATTAGSRVPAAELAGPESESVSALKRAGALIMGKTVTTEFAYFGPGATRNPVDRERTPGGSSSGSAAAVGAGLCPLTLGTQTIGSICRPASYCGAVGFKPTYDRTSRAGVIALAPSVDHIGCFAGDAAGVTLAASVLIPDWRSGLERRRPRLGIPESPYLSRASTSGRERFRLGCERLVAAGFEVLNVEMMADFDAVEARHRLLVAAEAARVHEPWFGTWGETYHEKTRELIETGLAVSDEALERALAGCSQLRGEVMAAMGERSVDLLLTPAAQDVAPLGLDSTGDPVMNLPWSHSGLPSVSLPLPCAPGELPFGLQLVGRHGDDERLLAWSHEIEETLVS